jgi:translation initiation factor IF-3
LRKPDTRTSGSGGGSRREEPGHRINHQIRAKEVRVVCENGAGENGKQVRLMPLSQALRLADEARMDLIEISRGSERDPIPVCTIMELGKFRYLEEKKHRGNGKHGPKEKEIGLHVNTAEHDLDTKVRHAKEFLQDGHPVLLKLQLRGRETTHQDLAIEMLKAFTEHLKREEIGFHQEERPRPAGRNIFLRISPVKK